MDHYISREKTIEAIKTDLSQFVYDEYGNMTALGVRLIHRIGNITGGEPFGNLIDRDELVKDIEGQTERDGRTSSDVITKGVLEVFLDYIRNFPSARPEQKGRECASCKHSNNGECAYTEECHKCMWESQYEQQAEAERKPGKTGHWIPGEMWSEGIGMGESYGYYFTCSECGRRIKGGYPNCGEPYCSRCGSRNEVDG